MREALNTMVYNDLYEKIKSNYYKPGQQLPTESELEKFYSVSKAPVRQALGKLQTDGLISRKAGKGTFVSVKIKKERTSFLGGFGSHFAKFKEHISYKTSDIKEIPYNEKFKKIFKKSNIEYLTCISRLRLVNEKPVFLLNHFVPNFDKRIFEKTDTIENMRMFLQKNGIEMDYFSEKIYAVISDDALQKMFKLKNPEALLKIIRKTFDKNYSLVVYEEYYVLSDNWPYEVQFHAE